MTLHVGHKKKEPRKKRSPAAKLVRFLLFCVLAVILLVVLLFSGLLLVLTPERVEKIAQDQFQRNVDRPLEFNAAHFSAFNGIVLRDINIPPPADSMQLTADFPLYSLRAKELSFRYSLREIFHKKFIITSALIDSPRIELRIFPTDTNSQKSRSPQRVSMDSVAALSPVALDLKSFRLRNAQITVDIPDSASNQRLFLSDISFAIEDMHTPQGDLFENQENIRGHFNLSCDHSVFAFTQETPTQQVDASGQLDVNLDISARTLQAISINGFIALSNMQAAIPGVVDISTKRMNLPIRGEVNGTLNAMAGTLDLPLVSLAVNEVPWAELQINVNHLLSTPRVHALVHQSRIPIVQLLRAARETLPDTLLPDIYLHDQGAFLSFAGTEINGTIPDTTGGYLSCTAKVHLRRLGLTIDHGAQLLQNLNFTSTTSFDIGLDVVKNATCSATVTIDSLAALLPASSKAFAGATKFSLSADLHDDLTPASAKMEIDIANLLGAALQGSLRLASDSGIDGMTGKGSLSLTGFNPSTIAPSPLSTTLSANADLSLNGLDDIRTKINVTTDSLHIAQNATQLDFAPLRVNSVLRMSTDTSLQGIELASLRASVNDILSLRASANAAFGDTITANFNLDRAALSHSALIAYIPEEIKAALAGVTITGSTVLTADGSAVISPRDTTFNAHAEINTHDFNIDYMQQLATANGINVHLDGRVNSNKSGSIKVDMVLDSVKTSNLPQSVFYDNAITLAASTEDFKTLTVDSGSINLPDLKTSGQFYAAANIESAIPKVTAHIGLHQAADDTIFITRDIFYSGQNNLDLKLQSDSLTATAAVTIKTKELTVSLPGDLRIDRINSNIAVAQSFDLATKQLVSKGSPAKTLTGGLVDYSLYRDYYRRSSTPRSNIHIRRIAAAGYVVEHVAVEAFIGNGRLDVPYLSLDVYGGNIGAALSVAANPENPLDSPYRLSAHLSGINSALVLPNQEEQVKGGLITAHAEITGRGFDIQRGIDLDGYFHITEIESRVADNLLRSLDPEGKDSGIRSTRLLINRGFKPRLFAFDIRHGYSYPAVYFDQPWYFPVRLSGGGIELGRIPIAFFLQQK